MKLIYKTINNCINRIIKKFDIIDFSLSETKKILISNSINKDLKKLEEKLGVSIIDKVKIDIVKTNEVVVEIDEKNKEFFKELDKKYPELLI